MMKKTALITGGAGGIGSAIALKLAQDGYDIVIKFRKELFECKCIFHISYPLSESLDLIFSRVRLSFVFTVSGFICITLPICVML